MYCKCIFRLRCRFNSEQQLRHSSLSWQVRSKHNGHKHCWSNPAHVLSVDVPKRSYFLSQLAMSRHVTQSTNNIYFGCHLYSYNSKRFSTTPKPSQKQEMLSKQHEHDRMENKIDTVKQKLLFNSVLESIHMKEGWLKMKIQKEREMKTITKRSLTEDPFHNIPIALKYVMDPDELKMLLATKKATVDNDEFINPALIQLPYGSSSHQDNISVQLNDTNCNDQTNDKESQYSSQLTLHNEIGIRSSSKSSNWMTDYDVYADREEDISTEEDNERPWQLDYGTVDPSIPISNVPCGGCGALLHCQDTSIPGYLPSELFANRKITELRTMTCQRCHFLKFYDTALAVNVSADEYPRLLAQIRDKRALVILMVDLMDFPCSIWPNILNIIGTKRPIVVVGNKVDLLPQDSRGFLDHMKNVLTQTLEQTGVTAANIKHVALISAKTGFGVDQLITKLHTSWEYKGDVYLIGCTNVGKSTLFNALLQSDYCKVKAVDLVQRATTSPWPGTTLNLLKFPILRPAAWRMFARTKRLIAERKGLLAEQQLRQHQAKKTRTAATLIGHIGRTFRPPNEEVTDPFAINTTGQTYGKLLGLNPDDKDYVDSMWCYDTPGTVQPDQVINLLTTEELMLTLPKRLLHPRTFSVTPGSTLFIAGLGRLDYVSGSKAIRFTVFASESLPITVCRTDDADEVYSTLLGSEFFAVPSGGEERLAHWPDLVTNRETIQLTGEDWKSSCADVVLSSAGWVAVTPGAGMEVELRAMTPEGRGIFVRPSLLPFAVNHRGARIRRSPAYKKGTGIYSRHV